MSTNHAPRGRKVRKAGRDPAGNSGEHIGKPPVADRVDLEDYSTKRYVLATTLAIRVEPVSLG
jgi:hypothetical protein